MRIKTIKVNWSYPILYENIFSYGKIYEKGIYYLSRKFGNNETLLYIGKTNNSFFNRLYCHSDWLSEYRGKILVRLGIIISPKNYDDSLITDIESAIIYKLKPIENTDKIKSYTYYNECKILNIGYKGVLPSVLSMREQI